MKQLPQKRGPLSAFAAPDPGETVEINPPSLQWVPEPEISDYLVRLETAAGALVLEQKTRFNCLQLRQKLSPGEYRWNVFAEDAQLGWRTFTVPENARDFLVPEAKTVFAALPETHPRHIYLPEDLAQLRAAHQPELTVLRRNIAEALQRPLMEYPDFYHETGRSDYRSILDEVRVFLDRDAVACALGWLFEREEAAGARARDSVLRVCEWNPCGPCSVIGIFRGDEVGLSICRTLPAIIDWTWDLYTEPQRRWIADTMKIHASHVYYLLNDQNFPANPGNSHSGRLSGYLGEMALVFSGIWEPELCEKYLNFALNIYGTLFPHYGGRDGGWAEGPFYGSSYTKWYLPFFFAVERLTGFSFFNKPFYRKLSQFFLHFAPPGQESHPFGDGNWPTQIEWPGFQAQNPFGVYAHRFGPEEARAFSRRLTEEIDVYKLHLLDVIPPVCGKTDPDAAGPAENSYCSYDTGLLSMRRSVADPEKDVALLARCSRYGSPSHQHADQGNFAVLAGGRALIAPSGTFGYRFGENHHQRWTVQTVAQNCILIDGEGQQKHSAEAVGKILEFSDNGTLCRTVFDLSAAYPMLQEYRRTLIFHRDTLQIEVADELSADHDVSVDFRLHSYAMPEETASGVRLYRAPGTAWVNVSGGAFRWTDRYRYPDDGGTEAAPNGNRPMVTQYHLNWNFPPARQHRITAAIQIEMEDL